MTAINVGDYDAGVFDLDGVVTDTASLHRTAWKDLFDAFLAGGDGDGFRPFTDDDYYRFVDGRPRYEGVRTFLQSRGIEVPYGDPGDPPERETICGLGNRKNEAFNRRLAEGGIEVFDSSVGLLEALRERGIRTALVTSSRNADAVLAAAKIKPLFDVIVDGNEATRQKLRGKPHPDTYRHVLEVLGAAPDRAFGVEDATTGVESIRAAGYRLVIGVDRAGQRQALLQHGAHIVVRDLGDLQLSPDGRQRAVLPDALAGFDDLVRLIRERRPALFLDYDGTLTPIVSRPELAVLDGAMRATLAELAEVFPVAIISGRDRRDVENLVGLGGLVFAGSHGFDIAGPGLKREYEGASRFLPALDEAEKRLREALAGIEGVIVERKRYAIAVHYRLVAGAEVAAVEQAFGRVLAEAGELRRTAGKKVFEMRPRLDWHKGKAVLWLLEELGLDGPDVLPVYIGDDETDEDAFAALAGRGIGILVADNAQASHAEYRLESPEAVRLFLRRLIAAFNITPPQ